MRAAPELTPSPKWVAARADNTAVLRPRPSAAAQLLQDRSALLGLAILAALCTLALAAPWLGSTDPAAVDAANRLAPPGARHPLGTDNLGRDTLSRLLHGGRVSLGTGLLATILVMTIGVTVGSVSGFYGGRLLDDGLMRVVDVLLAFPTLILALAITGTLGGGLANLILGLVVVWWASYARVVRGLALQTRERPFVEAALALGAPRGLILRRHVLPNVLPSVTVLATLDFGRILLALSGLSFLGLGAQPPTAEWGAMLNEARPYLDAAPQLMLAPGACITLAAMAVNLVGDGLRDVLDPHLRS